MDLLKRRWQERDTMVCVGLDPDPARLPGAYASRPGALLEFCTSIVDATAPLVCAFKPQIAYFAALGAEDELEALIAHVHRQHPQIPVILDAKRGDIGATARMYAAEAFERYRADAVTVNPYLGWESIEPYLAYQDRGVVVLCRTSNPDSGWLQSYPSDAPAFLRVASAVAERDRYGNLMLVAGATYVDDLRRIREAAGSVPLLVPGVGAQGGDVPAVVHAGRDGYGRGLVINASRSVLYASDPEAAARELRDEIRTAAEA
ncbi:MAG: orotidine-5'-phosphate decarboxylase [Pseudomonadota bacterium]